MTSADRFVLIMDDDYRVREAIQDLLAAAEPCSVALGSAAECIAYPKPAVPTCLILHVELPDINRLDLQRQIGDGCHPPIILVPDHGNIPQRTRHQGGSAGFSEKPFSEQKLLELVHAALAQDRERRAQQADIDRLTRHFQSLTPREREGLPLAVSGLLNKQAQAHPGISEVTLQIHRANVMRKMEADSLADLVRMAGSLDTPVSHHRHASNVPARRERILRLRRSALLCQSWLPS